MLNIIEVNNISNDDTWLLHESIGSYYVFFKRKFMKNEYSEITTFNFYDHTMKSYLFKETVPIISEISSSNTLYFMSLESGINNDFSVNRLSLDKMIVDKIKVNHSDTDLEILSLRSTLIGIDDRYCLLFLPNKNSNYKTNFYSDVLLIDFLLKTSCSVINSIHEYQDILLNISKCVIGENGNSIIFKSGRIQIWEKRHEWSNSSENYTREDLLVLNKADFLNTVLHNLSLRPIFQKTYSQNEIVGILSIENEKFSYFEEDLMNNKTKVYFLDLENKVVQLGHEDFRLFWSIEPYHNRICAKLQDKMGNDCKQYFTFDDQITCSTEEDDNIVYFDKNVVVSTKSYGNGKLIIKLKDQNSNKIIIFKDKKFMYFHLRNELVIY